jgi:hypothetical protein
MKKIFRFRIFNIIAIVVDSCILFFLFPLILMLLQYYLAGIFGERYYYIFYGILLLCLISIITLIIYLLKLKRWAFNIFFIGTFIINLIMVILLSKNWFFSSANIFLVTFISFFTLYFLKSSTKKLFDNK